MMVTTDLTLLHIAKITSCHQWRNMRLVLSVTWLVMLIVRGHLSISLLPLLSPTPPLSICIPHPHLCTISKDHTYSRRLSGPTVRRLSRSRLTNNRRLPNSHSTRTLAASDEPRTHWDRSTWHYGTLRHHVDTHIWEAWY
jgi:hypothetical protein